eukprot:EG_transcript_24789
MPPTPLRRSAAGYGRLPTEEDGAFPAAPGLSLRAWLGPVQFLTVVIFGVLVLGAKVHISHAALIAVAGSLGIAGLIALLSNGRRTTANDAIAARIAAAAEADFDAYAAPQPTPSSPTETTVPDGDNSVVELGDHTKCDIPRRHSW